MSNLTIVGTSKPLHTPKPGHLTAEVTRLA